MSDSKILLTFRDDEGDFHVESVWATKQGNYFRIDNIPFLAPNVALGDLVSAELNNGALYFDRLIEPSGHSVVQVVIFNKDSVPEIGGDLERLGCTWEGSHIATLISVDIPPAVSYSDVRQYLEVGEEAGMLSYKEACLAQ